MIWLLLLPALGALLVARSLRRLRRLREEVDAAWRQIDRHLVQRRALVPLLLDQVEMCSGTVALDAQLEAEEARGGEVAEIAEAERAVRQAIDAILEVANYEGLEAEPRLESLRADLASIDRRLRSTVAIYNLELERYRSALGRWPGRALGGLAGFRPRAALEAL